MEAAGRCKTSPVAVKETECHGVSCGVNESEKVGTVSGVFGSLMMKVAEN